METCTLPPCTCSAWLLLAPSTTSRRISAAQLALVGAGVTAAPVQAENHFPLDLPATTKKSDNNFRAGIFLAFVRRPCTTRTPHEAYVRGVRRSRVDPRWVESNSSWRGPREVEG